MAPAVQSPHALRKIQKRLKLLQCPLPLDVEDSSNNSNNEDSSGNAVSPRWTQLAHVVVWLEDRVIRHDPMDAREQLRDCVDGEQWTRHLNEYLARLSCPLRAELSRDDNANESSKSMILRERDLTVVVLWLTAHAVSLEFEENVDEITASLTSSADVASDPCSPAMLKALRALYEATQAAQGKETTTNQKNALTGNETLTKERLENIIKTVDFMKSKAQNPTKDGKADQRRREIAPIGEKVQHTTQLLRDVYIDDLKQLQLEINSLIARAQEYTADPKTDASLGKTGM